MTTYTPTATSVVDWNLLRSLVGPQVDDEPDFVGQIIVMFHEDSGARVDRAREAVQRGDSKALRLEAHALRGSAGMIGALLLREAATAVERVAEAGSVAAFGPLVEGMADAFMDVDAELARAPSARQ